LPNVYFPKIFKERTKFVITGGQLMAKEEEEEEN
jgi:hypothetical protein